MPILRLIAEGVGPFEKLDIDFSDGNGKPHLGPHILAGVNGSGKSTVLRTIAWVLDREQRGFQYDDWLQTLEGYPRSRAAVVLAPRDFSPQVHAVSKPDGFDGTDLVEWARGFVDGGLDASWYEGERGTWCNFPPLARPGAGWQEPIGAYSPSKALRHLTSPDLTKRLENAYQNCLGFESTVQNDVIHSWLLGLYSMRAIARERKEPSSEYNSALERLDGALRLLYGEEVSFDVDIEHAFLQARLRVRRQSLNFSQLPDGMRSTIAWVSDFMMRQNLFRWAPELKGKRPGILLLDEVDAHLHPLWQRKLLPAMRKALPEVQIIVTSHSPFVISSCEGARVHVLDVDAQGHAHAQPPVDSPFGESVIATLKDIFGVNSRFDERTEGDLNEWDKLKQDEARGALSDRQRDRLIKLTKILSDRSEELKSIVASPQIPASVVAALLGVRTKNGRSKRGKSVQRS